MSEPAKDIPETAATVGASGPPKLGYCSFCFKSRKNEVKCLVKGVSGDIFICSDCVELCNEWIAGRSPRTPKTPTPDELPTELLLERLHPIEVTIQGKTDQLQSVVDLLRSRSVSWARIGAALGISRQSAWERFT